MNVLIRSLVLSLLTTLLVSCGAKPTTANLKISSSFLMSNSGYNGGIILRGRSSANQNFTLSIPVGGGATNEATIELPKGTWTFYAAAWNGGAGSFQGNVFCGETSATLLNDVAKVEITVNQLNCNSGSFSGSYASVAAAAGNAFNTVRLFSLSSCGAFYVAGTNTPVVNGNSATVCDTGMPSDMKSKVKSFRIKAPNRTLNNVISAGFQSICYNASAISVIDAANVRLPTKNIPFIFEIFEETGCQDLIVDHPFLEGMEFNYPNVDKLFLSTSVGGVSLHLPSNEIKKGYSPFYHILPSFKCNGADCVPHAAGYDYYAKRNLTISVQIDNAPGARCSDYSSIVDANAATPASSGIVSSISCPDPDKAIAQFTVKTDNTTCSDSNSNPVDLCWSKTGIDFVLSITKGGTTINKVVRVLKENEFESIRLAREHVGKSAGAPKLVDNNNYDKDEDYDGALSSVREMLGPSGPGGLFGTPNTAPSPAFCDALSGSKTITFKDQENQKDETYRVDVGAANYFVPNTLPFFCDNGSYTAGCPPGVNTTYNKRLSAYKLYGPGDFRLKIVLNFNCSTEAGVMMDINDEIKDNGNRNINKKVIVWTTPNTTPLSKYQRLEKYSLSKEFDSSGTLTNINTNLVRLQKDEIASTAGNIYEVDGVQYSRSYITPATNPVTYKENATRFFLKGEPGKLAYEGDHSSLNNSTAVALNNIFTDTANAGNRAILSKGSSSSVWDSEINPTNLITLSPGGISWRATVSPTTFQLSTPALSTGIESADPDLMDVRIFNYLTNQTNPLFQ